MWLLDILLKPLPSSANSFLDKPRQTTDYKKIKSMAEMILESQSATKEQRQKANKWLGACNKAMK